MIDVVLRMLRLKPMYPPIVGEHDHAQGLDNSPVRGNESHFWFKVYPHHHDTHDPLLAKLLRGAIRCVQSFDPTLKTVVLGPTLLGWYQLRSQLPWKKEIHVGVFVESVAKLSFRDMVPFRDKDFVKSSVVAVSDAVQHIAIQAGKRKIDFFIFRLPSGVEVRKSAIDAGTPIHVPVAMKVMLRDRYKGSLAIRPSPGWKWNKDSQQFVRLSFMHYALSWPPTESTLLLAAKAAILVVLLFLCWIIVSYALSK